MNTKLFKFLRDLDQNNNRDWFLENKERYEVDVRNPVLKFISDFEPYLKKFAPGFVADPRPVGGSMFRIYRDARFSNDKTPYKTHVGVQFRHKRGKDVHAPGFYLHLEPRSVFAAAGLWRPESEPLLKIREAIVAEPDEWKHAISNRAFKKFHTLGGDALKRPPKGFPADHPSIEDLKRKDFICAADLSEKDVCAPDFALRLAEIFQAASPFMKFLTLAVELDW